MKSSTSELCLVTRRLAWFHAHWTSEVNNLLAQQENLLALDDQMGLFSSPEVVAVFCMNPV